MSKITVSGIYTKSYEKVLNLQIKSCKDDYIFDFRFITDEEWEKAKKTKDFAFFGGNILKTQLVIDKIKENWGQILLIADADLVFFRKTEEQILEELGDLDCIFLKERFSSEYLYDKALSNINIGFVAIKCNERNLKFWEEVQQQTKDSSGWDQEIANKILLNKNYDLKWAHFSENFANGGSINQYNLKDLLIGTSCGTIAKKYKLTKYDYLKKLIKYYNYPKNLWFDTDISLENIFKQIFSIKNSPDKLRKIITILGTKISIKNKKYYSKFEKYYYLQKTNIQASVLHPKTFLPYQNCHREESLVLVACGPSLKYYQPLLNAKHIGVNRAFLKENIKLDYLFIQDYLKGTNNDMYIAANYRVNKCIKFYGIIPELRKNCIGYKISPLSYQNCIDANANIYILEDEVERNFAQHLNFEPIGDFKGCIFSALQFALYTNPKKIYLAGCDCTDFGHFHKERSGVTDSLSLSYQVKIWEKLAFFLNSYYPKTEIISINPIGLRGLFKDVYTEDFIKDNPELTHNKDIQILTNKTFESAKI